MRALPGKQSITFMQLRARGRNQHSLHACVHVLASLHACGPQEFVEITDLSEVKSVQGDLVKSQIRLALQWLYDKNEMSDGSLKLRSKPTKGLWAMEPIKKGELKLVPMSPLVYLAVKSGDVPSVAIPMDAVELCKGAKVTPYINPKIVLPRKGETSGSQYEETFVVPFWFVRPVVDATAGNTELRTQAVNVSTGWSTDVEKESYYIPYLTNTVNLKAGDEITFYNSSAKGVTNQAPAKRSVPPVAEPKKKGGRKA